MPTLERFTEREVTRILGVAESRLAYWQKLSLVRPQSSQGRKVYCFLDLISLRTIKQLTDQRIPATQLRRAVLALSRQLQGVKAPLSELRILSDGRSIIVEHQGQRIEPLSGQLVLSFDTRELAEKICPLPSKPSSGKPAPDGDAQRARAEGWLARALELESETAPARRSEAIDAYRQALQMRPAWVEARLNLGTLLFEEGLGEEAAREFQQAADAAPQNPLARFNLAAALDELGRLREAKQQLLEALRLSPRYADACYNLAALCEKMGELLDARRYWTRYLELDSRSSWAVQARRRLAMLDDHSTSNLRPPEA